MTQLFSHLTPEQERKFRQWARENYKPFDPIDGVWHPVVQDECVQINADTGYSPDAITILDLMGGC